MEGKGVCQSLNTTDPDTMVMTVAKAEEMRNIKVGLAPCTVICSNDDQKTQTFLPLHVPALPDGYKSALTPSEFLTGQPLSSFRVVWWPQGRA